MYQFDFDVFWLALKFIGMGVPLSFGISLAALVLGVVVGVPIGIITSAPGRIVNTLLGAYVEIFRNIPVLVQIVWVYYVLPILTGINLDPVTAGIIALGLNTSAFLAEIIRGGIIGVPTGQRETASTLGFSPIETMQSIILPQVMRKMMAPFLNQFIVLIKESALVAYIGVVDLMHRGDLISTQFSRPLEAYTVVAIWYFVLCFCASRASRYVEAKLAIPE